MFSKAALFVASTFALLAAAKSANVVTSCNTGSVYCCNQIEDASTFNAEQRTTYQSFAGSVGPATGQFGFTCLAGAYKGAAGNSCTQQTACCTGQNYNGFIVAGCSPFNANL